MGSVDYDYVVCFAATIPVDEVAWVVLAGSDLSIVETQSVGSVSGNGRGGVSLKESLKTFEDFVVSKLGSGPESCCVLVNGERLLRDSLRLECEQNGVRMPKRFNRFFDVQSEFRHRYPLGLHSLGSMLEHVGLHQGDLSEVEHKLLESGGPALSEAMMVARLFRHLVKQGHRLHSPITVSESYRPGDAVVETSPSSPKAPATETQLAHEASSPSATAAAPEIPVVRITGLPENSTPDGTPLPSSFNRQLTPSLSWFRCCRLPFWS